MWLLLLAALPVHLPSNPYLFGPNAWLQESKEITEVKERIRREWMQFTKSALDGFQSLETEASKSTYHVPLGSFDFLLPKCSLATKQQGIMASPVTLALWFNALQEFIQSEKEEEAERRGDYSKRKNKKGRERKNSEWGGRERQVNQQCKTQ